MGANRIFQVGPTMNQGRGVVEIFPQPFSARPVNFRPKGAHISAFFGGGAMIEAKFQFQGMQKISMFKFRAKFPLEIR